MIKVRPQFKAGELIKHVRTEYDMWGLVLFILKEKEEYMIKWFDKDGLDMAPQTWDFVETHESFKKA